MPREGIYIGDDKRLPREPTCAADPSTSSDTSTSNIPLEWPKHQLIALYQVEAYPEEAKGLAQCSGCIGKVCDEIGLPIREALQLGIELLVALFSRGRLEVELLCHRSSI